MRHVFDTWLVKACKQQEYRMGENRVKVTFFFFNQALEGSGNRGILS